MPHTITVEPLTRALRIHSGRWADPAHLAIVERHAGELLDVRATTGRYEDAYPLAREWATRTGAESVLQSSFGPTVVGADVAATVAADPNCQPLPLFSLACEVEREGATVPVVRREIPAHVVEKVGTLAVRLADRGKCWNIAAFNADGEDVTFDFEFART